MELCEYTIGVSRMQDILAKTGIRIQPIAIERWLRLV